MERGKSNPDGYSYSLFCEIYQQWRGKVDVVLRQEHLIFVAVLGASNYWFAEATWSQDLACWMGATSAHWNLLGVSRAGPIRIRRRERRSRSARRFESGRVNDLLQN